MVAHGRADEADIDWLHLLSADGQLIADLAFPDIVLWVPTNEGSFIAVAHSRPSSAATLSYRDFPDLGAPSGPRRGAPRASDGLVRLDIDGNVTFASPNGLSAFNRMGFEGELEGESLAEVTTALLKGKIVIDESLPLVVTGR